MYCEGTVKVNSAEVEMKKLVFMFCSLMLVPLIFLSCGPNQEERFRGYEETIQGYEETLREYQNEVKSYEEQVYDLEVELEKQNQLIAKYQRDFENAIEEKEQLQTNYIKEIDELNLQIEKLQDELNSLNKYESTYSSKEVIAIVKQHEKAKYWTEDAKDPYTVVRYIKWDYKYSGAGKWLVTMSMVIGDGECFIVFGFDEHTKSTEIIRENCV